MEMDKWVKECIHEGINVQIQMNYKMGCGKEGRQAGRVPRKEIRDLPLSAGPF